MIQIRNIAEAEEVLSRYIPAVRQVTGKDITLERIGPLMKALGDPQDKLKVIHIAGTSGKTSTAYYIASLLEGQGRKIGLTVSPHIDSITERVQVNLQPLDEPTFCAELAEFIEIIDGVDPEPTYFELLVAFAYWYFAKAGVDYAVVETGFGGTHDGTNTITRPDKVCVITDIGLDHMRILGETVEKISSNKAGIIHKGNTAFMYRQADAITNVFSQRAGSVGANLELVDQDGLDGEYRTLGLENFPLYQQRNWLLARKVCDFVAERDGFTVEESAIMQSLRARVPGRMDIQTVKGRPVVMDGAHNEQKMQAFVQSFSHKFPGKKAAVLLALKQGKEHKAVLPILLPMTSKLIVTTFDAVQDLPTPSHDVQTLADAAKEAGFVDVAAFEDSKQAYDELLRSPDELLVVTGSFYLLSIIREYLWKSTVRAIAAIDDKRGLASEQGIPWDLPTDRAYTREKTMGGSLLMGYNTYLEFPRALERRRWYVVHEATEPLRDGFESVTDVRAFMGHPPENLWLFGGAGVFAQTIEYADELYLTRVEGDFGCTKFFPEFEDKFELAEQSEPHSENDITFRYEIWRRKN